MIPLGQLVSAAQPLDRGAAGEGLLGGAEALADHVAEVVLEHVLLGRDDLREAVHALGLRHRGLDQQDAGARCDRVRVLHVQRGLPRPADHVGVARVVGGYPARGVDHGELRRCGQAEGPVEHAQVVPDRRRAERVDDDDRGAPAGHAAGVHRGQAISPPDLGRLVARDLVGFLTVSSGRRTGLRAADMLHARLDGHVGQGSTRTTSRTRSRGARGNRTPDSRCGGRGGHGDGEPQPADRNRHQPRHTHQTSPSTAPMTITPIPRRKNTVQPQDPSAHPERTPGSTLSERHGAGRDGDAA